MMAGWVALDIMDACERVMSMREKAASMHGQKTENAGFPERWKARC
jgi:hypothetical protein